MYKSALIALFAGLASAQSSDLASASSLVASATSAASSLVASASSSGSAASPSGSQDFGTGLLAALRARGANTLASLIEPMAGTLVPILQNGQWTVNAPSDEALSGVDTSNSTALQQILSYHIVPGSYPVDAITMNNTVASTLLTGAPAVNLGSNMTNQALAFYKDQFGTTRFVGQDASVLANATYQNVLVKLIDNVLMVPGPIPSVLAGPAGVSALVQLASSAAPDVVSALNTTAGLTVFAPTNEAVSAVAGPIGQVAGSMPQLVAQVIQAHAIPMVVYSTNVTDGLSANNLVGSSLTFAVNTTGVFVTGNGVTAKLVQTDFIAANGVVHTIDRVLFDPASVASALSSGMASSAAGPAQSASSAAGGAVSSATDAAGGAVSTATGAAGGAVSTATGAVGGAINTATSAVGGVINTVTSAL